MEARRTQALIKINRVEVTQDISPYLTGVTYIDELSGKTDSVTLNLADKDSLFIKDWSIEKGSTLEVTLVKRNWDDGQTEELELGIYEVDELEYDYPPSVMRVKSLSCPQNSYLRQVDQSKSWENVKLSEIARDIATAAQVELFYETEEDPEIKRAEQGEKSALGFLEELCAKYYLAVKFSDGQLIIFDESELDKAEPVMTLKRGDSTLKKVTFKTTLTGIYKACEVNYKNNEQAENYQGRFEDPTKESGKVLKVNRKVNTQAEADKLARNSLREKNKREHKMRVTCAGEFKLVAGNVLKVEGFGTFDDKWLIEKASHRVGGEYEVRLECRKCLGW